MDIGERIKARREQLGMTQDELAKKVGYTSRAAINKIEKGSNNLTQRKIRAIADALYTTPSFIMGWEEEENTYYLDAESSEIAQEIYEKPELRMLFDASRKVSPEDLKFVIDMVERLKDKEK